MRRTVLTLSLLAAIPLGAQQQQSLSKDSSIKSKSAGLPAGWTARLDDKERRYSADDARFEIMGSGYHVTSGPAAVYYSEMHKTQGSFAVRATLTQMKAPSHAEAYGIFIGGAELLTAQQQYFYFLVRGDGKYYIAHRAGSEVHSIVPWSDNAAVKKQDESGKQSNELVIQVTADSVHLLVNSQRVRSFARSELRGFNTDGHVGLRVNHGLDVHVGTFEIRKN
jgi:hypothetical protein